MAPKSRYRNRIELLQGTLDLLILQTLQWGPQHGYGISNAIRANSGSVLQVDTGSLYPGSNGPAGLPPNGKCRKTGSECASTGSPPPAGSI